MPFTKEEIQDDVYNTGELYEYLHNLNSRTETLCREIFDEGVENVKMIDLRLAEIYSLFNTAKLFLSIKGDLNHYEISSLLSFWEKTYFQMYLVARDSDKNTSWMHSEFENYSEQYKIVEKMIKSHIEQLKQIL